MQMAFKNNGQMEELMPNFMINKFLLQQVKYITCITQEWKK